MTDTEILDYFGKLIENGHSIQVVRNNFDVVTTCFGRTGYGPTLRESLASLKLHVEESITERIAQKLLS